MKKILTLSFSFLFLISNCFSQESANPLYHKGVVVSARAEASQAGLLMLKKGGNAIDAAIAVQFALAVVYPNAGNIGGGGFLIYRSAAGAADALDFREKAPSLADRDMYLDKNGNAMQEKSLYGNLASGVPGTVDGMVKAHEKYGKLSWRQCIQPAIDLAAHGFYITKKQAADLNHNHTALATYNPDGTALVKKTGLWVAGDKMVQKELARTLELIRDKGRAGFYEGEVASKLVAAMKGNAGIISARDLQEYQSVWRTPVTGTYKDVRIITMPPPSSGGIALVQLFQSISPFPVSRWGYNSDSASRLIIEAERRVYADRAVYLGDPDFFKVPVKQLTDPAYQKTRMASLNWDHASSSTEISAGKIAPKESDQTTHYSIIDKEGNGVSVTTTLNGAYGSYVVVKGGGYLMNNEMDDFSVKPGSMNAYGLVGGEANSIAPGKRMLSSMTPTILEKNGKLFMVVGTPGGATIITSVFQAILNVIEFNMTMQQAVEAKRFHSQWLPDVVYSEKEAFTPAVLQKLKDKGYKLAPNVTIGRVDGILATENGYRAGADPRGDDTACGW